MKKPLIIVESPTKARTIKKFLPARYAVKASVGHVRDLPKSTLGVDVEHDFAPRYLTIKGKGDVIKELRGAVKGATDVYLATDPDREGEAIAWHLAELLKLPDPKRIELHEITKEAALAALRHPHHIDMDRVNAQQARRILDRLVGYKISPLLWAKVRGGLSAGRVQSVAVKLIVDREREIRAFVPREYWSITAQLAGAGDPAAHFGADLVSHRGEKLEIANKAQVDEITAALDGAEYRVASVKKREVRRNAPAPFTTSTLQQEASRKLKMRVRRAMQVAQALYEGIDLGGREGTVGLITYMRTDSTRLSDQARDAARDFIVQTYGEAFHGGVRHKVKEGAQDAHEAIRPTSVLRTPDSVAGALKREELRLYTLIWERFVASQMSPALLDQTVVDVSADGLRLPRDRDGHALPGLHSRLRREQGRGRRRQRPRAAPRIKRRRTARSARGSSRNSTLPNRRRDTARRRWSKRWKIKASAARRPTRRSSRRFRRAVTSRSKNGDLSQAKSVLRSTTCSSITFRRSSISTLRPAWRAISTGWPRATKIGSRCCAVFTGRSRASF